MIYLNNAATSYPKPPIVLNGVCNAIKNIPIETSRSNQKENVYNIEFYRKEVAAFLGLKEYNRLIFTSGATEAINLAIIGLLNDNDHVITTAIEHNSVLRPLHHLRKDKNIEITIIPCDQEGYVSPDDIIKSIKPNTKLIVISHASNVTGKIQDIKSISDYTFKNNIPLLLDASQSVGNIEVNYDELKVDFLAFTGHKYLFATQGIGGLIISDKYRLKPLKTGGTGVRSDLLYQPEELPYLYEAGTLNYTGIISLFCGIKYILNTTYELIQNKCNALLNTLLEDLFKYKDKLTYLSRKKFNDNTFTPILTFNLKDLDPNDVGYILENSYKIIVRSGLHCAPLIHKCLDTPKGTVRLSVSPLNNLKEIRTTKKAITEILKSII